MMRWSRTSRNVATPAPLPPKLADFGHQPFTSSERESLARLLREPAWPRETLNIYSLEGYLTALLVWPVTLQPGAWLPAIWNETSWRVRPPIDTEPRYGQFMELVLGFLRTIDHGLLQTPPKFASVIHLLFADDLEMLERTRCWTHGFGRGLRQGVQAQVAPTPGTREAVNAIAELANNQRRLTGDTERIDALLTEAVLALASARMSRGPLGALPKHSSTQRTGPAKVG